MKPGQTGDNVRARLFWLRSERTKRHPPAFGHEGRKPSLRSRRRRLRLIAAVAGLGLVVGAAYGVSYLSYLPQYSVNSIMVAGAREIPERFVRAYIESKLFDGRYQFFSRSNIFLYPQSEIERAVVEYFPGIRSVKISRASLLTTAITATIEERKTFARWCASVGTSAPNDAECYFLSEEGVVFTRSTLSATVVPYVFRGGILATSSAIGQRYLPGHFASMLALLERLGQAGFPAREVVAEGDQDFSVLISRGFAIRASFGTDINGLVKNLELILSSAPLKGKEDRLEYVDLRFGNRVFYKLRGGEQQSVQ